jgi:uncharacterized Ntn-hydrolase superfamily protein
VTYSIVARDPESGDLGVAVQSRAFATGAGVPWAEPGVGAVASQAFGDASYGGLGLRLLRAGKTPEQALAALRAADPDSEVRQVAIVAASGEAAVHTGESCIPDAGHVVGDGFAAQANMCRGPVWEAMAEAYVTARGSLPRRLLAALDAAEAAGGDFRGRQAAGLLVRPAEGQPWDRVSNLRVDDHPEPLAELRRLLRLEEAYRRRNRLDDVVHEDDIEAAAAEIEAARSAGLPELDVVLTEVTARLLAGDVVGAREAWRPLLDAEPRWRGYLEFVAARHLPRARELLDG